MAQQGQSPPQVRARGRAELAPAVAAQPPPSWPLLPAVAAEFRAKSADGKVELRFSWWGGDKRAQLTQAAIAAFEAENPNIKIKPEYGDWSGYWDKLATQVAANDAPDIIQMDEKYITEYSSRGALLDLSKYDIDTSKLDEAALNAGKSEDGLTGIAAGINAATILANPAVFKAAGVELPDDKQLDVGRLRTHRRRGHRKVAEGHLRRRCLRHRRGVPRGLASPERQVAVHLGRQTGLRA